MRRIERQILFGVLIIGGILALLDILLQWFENRKKGFEFTWENYNAKRTFKCSLIGAAIGGGVGYANYCSKIKKESNLPFNSNTYLKKILASEHLKPNSPNFKNADEIREKIKIRMVENFGTKLAAFPEDTGSVYKSTAIVSNYDFDIILPFKRSSFPTLEQMFCDVYEVAKKEFGDIATINKQTKAIGITFEKAGNSTHFDVVPGRELKEYKKEKDLNLYVKPDWIWQRGSSFKTNIHLQKNITVNKPEVKNVIKLLKAYRDRNSLPLPTLIIEQCSVDALSENNFGIQNSQTENLLNCMDFISRKLNQKNIIDFANSSNNLNDKLTNWQKIQVTNQIKKDVKRIIENSKFIKEIFECY
jgi:hypothetical protein